MTENKSQDPFAGATGGIAATMVESFVGSVVPVLEQAQAPKYVMEKWNEFVSTLHRWAKNEPDVSEPVATPTIVFDATTPVPEKGE